MLAAAWCSQVNTAIPVGAKHAQTKSWWALPGGHNPAHTPPCDLAAKQGSQREAAISTGCHSSSLQKSGGRRWQLAEGPELSQPAPSMEQQPAPPYPAAWAKHRRDWSLRGAVLWPTAFWADSCSSFLGRAPASIAPGWAWSRSQVLRSISTVTFPPSACCFLTQTATALRCKWQQGLLAKPRRHQ